MSAPKFGTSGLRGLVTGLTAELIGDHIRAFARSCPTGGTLYIGQDLRPSSPRIAADVAAAALAEGLDVVDCGALPTPALALASIGAGAAAVMITGSHIPADRNGLKFYTPEGEITKAHETAITAALGQAPGEGRGRFSRNSEAGALYLNRYLSALGAGALAGRRIGLYAHSAVGRDLMAELLCGLGAEVVELGRSETFIPVDTEAVDPEVRAQIRLWVAEHRLDALISTDGDADRPLLADERGEIVAGDLIGQIASEALGAEVVVTPVSSNSGVLEKGFARVIRTKIGSPFVIAAMEEAGGRVAGYEANGGYLLGFTATGPAGPLPALPTRDAVLPLLMALIAPGPLSARVAAEPPVVTLADRLQEIPTETSAAWLQTLRESDSLRAALLARLGQTETGRDETDGLRITLAGGNVLHFRPSGNAPEFRVYVEARAPDEAQALLAAALQLLNGILRE